LLTAHFVLANETTLFILVNAIDFFVTYVLLAWPDSPAYEANPIARRMFHLGLPHLIGFKFGAATVAVVCCELVARRRPKLGRSVIISLTLVVTLVAIYGLRLIVQHLVARY